MRVARRGPGLAAGIGLLVLGAAPGFGAGAAPPVGSGCRPVAAGSDLQAAVDAAPSGATLCLVPGDHAGPVRIARAIRVQGPREAVIHSRGDGSTVVLEGSGSGLAGVTVDGSGGRFDLLDAAVRVRADRVRVEGVRITNALFGILAERCRFVEIRGNRIEGQPGKALGMRGDSIRIWEVRESRIADNHVQDGRDVVVWYSPDNHVLRNEVVRGRYGTHFMYSHGNVVEDNVYRGNVVGIFAMYSRDLVIRRNLLAESTGAAGVGLGSKESSALVVLENRLIGNTVGVWLDTSPLDPADTNLFRHNIIAFAEAGVVFHGRADGNVFERNELREHRVPVRIEGRGDARAAVWRGNAWGDYAGYDLDGDGTGDVPYELRSLESELVGRWPTLAFLRGSVAMTLVELVGRVVPLFQPRTLLVDPEPAIDLGLRGALSPPASGASGAG